MLSRLFILSALVFAGIGGWHVLGALRLGGLNPPDLMAQGEEIYRALRESRGEDQVLRWSTKNLLQNELFQVDSLFPKNTVETSLMAKEGVSRVFLEAQKLPKEKRQEFLQANKDKLHILERRGLNLSPEERSLSGLNMSELDWFNNGVVAFVTQRGVWALHEANENQVSYIVRPLQVFHSQLTSLGLELKQSSCDLSRCFGESQARLSHLRYSVVMMALVLLSLLGLATTQFFRRRQILIEVGQERDLIMQTLAHELRHPVTSLKLTLETLRQGYESLSDLVQTEFFRMSDQVARLERLTDVSSQYIRSKTKGQSTFRFRIVEIPSFNDYFLDVCDAYKDRVELRPLTKDESLEMDPYWFGLCLTNLVKNALIHGQKPIMVEALATGKWLEVRVHDAGPLPEKSFSELVRPDSKKSAKGLGIGLSLVYRIIGAMGGELQLHREPKHFSLQVRRHNGNPSPR